ncbi:MAG: hypothetical protein QMC89_02165 [Candidatus Hodarchaeaceae archaeon]|nr:hypothetical protein [Candidatus Hodarchaeaceae archaeon]
MRKIITLLMGLAIVLSTTVSASAQKSHDVANASQDIIIEKYVHYVTPPWAGWRVSTDENDPSYKLFRGGVKWSSASLPVTYHVDPDNAPVGAVSEVQTAFETWDNVVTTELYNYAIVNSDAQPSLDTGVVDYVNTVTWRPIPDTTIIAVTYLAWNRVTKELVEFDIIFNSNLAWDIDRDGEGGVELTGDNFDVRNIATHEAGHTLVLDDLYKPKARELTMYGYSEPRETKKRSLGLGDRLGIEKLYA